ncbi:protein phosphatase inhibitor protein [Medicago truncatula]|uniref:Protein phosphatase inhibitor protein n=1 Tax=Medicago truncatula TaxID=3880 RepID=G7KZF5_MEDTR|nr:protein phosphatase inhibitor protein [Medicago truncatula]
MDRRRSTNRPVALSSPSVTGATTITIESSVPSSSSSRQEQQQPEVLFLLLNRKKKKVSWKDGTVDNEFMQKKSSKKCCIFHKEKPFDEDDSDEDDVPHDSDKHPHDHSDNGFCCKNHDEAGPNLLLLAIGNQHMEFIIGDAKVTWTLGVVSLLGIWFSAPTIFYIVKVSPGARELADKLGVKLFIEEKKKKSADEAATFLASVSLTLCSLIGAWIANTSNIFFQSQLIYGDTSATAVSIKYICLLTCFLLAFSCFIQYARRFVHANYLISTPDSFVPISSVELAVIRGGDFWSLGLQAL